MSAGEVSFSISVVAAIVASKSFGFNGCISLLLTLERSIQ
jgi:hypothetical protein